MLSARCWSLAPYAVLGAVAFGCASDREVDMTVDSPRQLEGRLEVIIAEGPQGGTRYFLVPDAAAADVVELAFEREPDSSSGTRIGVNGYHDGEKFVVSDLERREVGHERGRLSQGLSGVTPERTRTIAFVMVDYGLGVNLTEPAIQQFMFGTANPGPTLGLGAKDKSTLQFYDETSYGFYGISGDVEGPLSWSGAAACNGPGGSQLARQLQAQITKQYGHYVWYYGSRQSACEYGWGSLGTWSTPSSHVWFNGDLFDGAVTHEIGHNLGYQHASSIRCNGAPLANDPLTCTTTEYGSEVSIMGNLANGHMMAIEKWYAGWFEGCNAVRVRSSGSFNLLPIETPCGGVQALQIAMPVTTRTFDTQQSRNPSPARYYYLEYRNGTGLDTGMTPSVVVVASDEIAPPSRTCARSVQLDMNPATRRLDGMLTGQTYTDPAGGVTFTVTSLTPALATVSVTLSAAAMPNTCMDGAMLSGSGPSTCERAGAGSGGSSASGGASGSGSAGASGLGGRSASGGASATAEGGGTAAGSAGAASAGSMAAGAGSGGWLGGGAGGTAGAILSSGAAGILGSAGSARSNGGAGTSLSGGSGGARASATGSTGAADASGCGCRVAGETRRGSTALWSLAAVTALMIRRRAPRRQTAVRPTA